MFTITYFSRATSPFTRQDLAALLLHARASNSRKNISGGLVHRDGRFMQVLEGREEDVRALYARIVADPRHTVGFTTSDPAAVRRFAKWHMAFTPLDAYDAGAGAGVDDGFGQFFAGGSVNSALPPGINPNNATFDHLYAAWLKSDDSPIGFEGQHPGDVPPPPSAPEESDESRKFHESGAPDGQLLLSGTKPSPVTMPVKGTVHEHVGSSGVVAAIFEMIMAEVHSGALMPGDRVSDALMSERLGVSRTPVREALQKLREIGVVEVAANRFTRIAVVELPEAAQMITVLAALYSAVLDEVIGQVDAATFDSLRVANGILVSTLTSGNRACFASAAVDFFMILTDASANDPLKKNVFALAHVIKLAGAHLDTLIGFEVIAATAETLVLAAQTGDNALAQRAFSQMAGNPHAQGEFDKRAAIKALSWDI